ncbi:MAG: cytochrome c [Oscillochloris sp.]|nr:cytochrome c [Oscillochloris sp.]
MAHVRTNRITSRLLRLAWLPLCVFLAACHVDMYDQPRYEPNEVSTFFDDGRAVQPPVPNTVAIGRYEENSALYSGVVGGELATDLPIELNAELLERGQKLFNAYCAPCHGMTGDGNGVIAYRGPIAVPSLHNDRLRTVALGYYFDVITNGVGRMYPYGSRIEAPDRWAVIAYVRALQLSQNAPADALSADDRTRLGSGE